MLDERVLVGLVLVLVEVSESITSTGADGNGFLDILPVYSRCHRSLSGSMSVSIMPPQHCKFLIWLEVQRNGHALQAEYPPLSDHVSYTRQPSGATNVSAAPHNKSVFIGKQKVFLETKHLPLPQKTFPFLLLCIRGVDASESDETIFLVG